MPWLFTFLTFFKPLDPNPEDPWIQIQSGSGSESETLMMMMMMMMIVTCSFCLACRTVSVVLSSSLTSTPVRLTRTFTCRHVIGSIPTTTITLMGYFQFFMQLRWESSEMPLDCFTPSEVEFARNYRKTYQYQYRLFYKYNMQSLVADNGQKIYSLFMHSNR